MMRFLQAVGELSNVLDEQCHMIVLSVEATRICEYARQSIPAKEEEDDANDKN